MLRRVPVRSPRLPPPRHRSAGQFGLRPGEDVGGQLIARTGHDGIGLGAKRLQFLQVLRGEGFLITEPTHGSVVADAGFCAVSQPVVCHGQEEKVKSIKLTLTGLEAFFQRSDRVDNPSSTVQRDAQRVKAFLFPRRQRHGNCRQPDRQRRVALELGARSQLPGQFVEVLVEFQNCAQGLRIDLKRRIELIQSRRVPLEIEKADSSIGPQVTVKRTDGGRGGEIAQSLIEASLPEQRMTTLVQRLRIIGSDFEALGTLGDELLSQNGVLLGMTVLLFDESAKSPVINLERRQRGAAESAGSSLE
jgi:hypothetical protein